MFCEINFFDHSPNGKDSGISNYVNSVQGSSIINASLISSINNLVKKPNEDLKEGYFIYSRVTMNNGDTFYIDRGSYEKLGKLIAKINTK